MSESEPRIGPWHGASDEEVAGAVEEGHRAYWWLMTVMVVPRDEVLTATSVQLRTADGVVTVEPGATPRDVYTRMLDLMVQRLRQDRGIDIEVTVLHWDLRPNEALA